MSRKGLPTRVLEWSANGVRLYDAAEHAVSEYRDATHAGQATGGGPVVLAISRRTSYFRTMPLPNAPRADLRRLIEFQASSVFPIPAADLAFDFQPTDEIGPEGRTALVAAMPTTELKRAFDEVHAAGFGITKVVPTAMGSALVAHEMGLADAVVIEDTPEGLAVDAVSGGELRLARVTPGASPIEEAARTAALAGMANPPIVAGPGQDAGEGALQAPRSPLAALVGPSGSCVTLDLEPREVVEKRERAARSNRRRLAVLLAAAALGLIAVVYFDYTDAQARVTRQTGKLTVSVNRLKKTRAAAESDATRAQRNKQVLDLAFNPAQPLTDVVTVVANEAPEGVWLTGITAERGKPLLIRGTATHSQAVAEFLDRLGKNERFRDVRLVFSNNGTISVTQIVQFSISAFPVGNLPLAETSTRRKT